MSGMTERQHSLYSEKGADRGSYNYPEYIDYCCHYFCSLGQR